MREFVASCVPAGLRFGGGQTQIIYPTDEEVIRCRDCKHHVTEPTEPGKMMCRRKAIGVFGLETGVEFMTDPDGFCAWAKRREL